MNEIELMSDLAELLAKHNLKNGILLVPIGNEGTSCFRYGADEKTAARIMSAVAADLSSGNHDSQTIGDN